LSPYWKHSAGDEDSGDVQEAKNISLYMKEETGIVPKRVENASIFSSALAKEHLREKKEMLKPRSLNMKDVFAIAFAVSASIRDRECEKIYLEQLRKNGGTKEEVEDILTTVRFIVGNRAYVNSLDILKDIAERR